MIASPRRTSIGWLLVPLTMSACTRDWSFLDSSADAAVIAPDGSLADASESDAAIVDAPVVDGAELDAAAIDSSNPRADAAPDQGASDAAATMRCDPFAPFDPPVLLPALNSAIDEESAVLSDDERTIYFARGTWEGAFDIFVATRAHVTDDFGGVQRVLGVSTSAMDIQPAPAPGGLAFYVDSYAGGARHVQVARRASITATFGPLAIVSELASPSDEDGTPYLNADGSAIYFTSSRVAHHFDIYRAELGASGTFGPPTPLDAVNDPDWFDAYPVVSADELTLYFGSGRASHTYSTQIYVAHRAHRSDPFGAPVPVAELASSDFHNYPSWLSPDGCRLYFTSSRVGGMGTPVGTSNDTKDIWLASRKP